MGEQLDQTGVQEDTGRCGVEHPRDNVGSGTITIVRLPNPESNGDTDGRANGITKTGEVWCPPEVFWDSKSR